MRKAIFLLWPLLVPYIAFAQIDPLVFQWDTMTNLPPLVDTQPNPGLAGAFVGIDGDKLILGGGANFPDGPAWTGGSKVFHDRLYCFDMKSHAWIDLEDDRLKMPIAYGLSLQTDQGIFCAGGTDGTSPSAESFLLGWDQTKGAIVITPLPSLPQACANLAGAMINNWIYVVASTPEKHFWRINSQDFDKGWEKLTSWPGTPRSFSVSVSQNDGSSDCLYIFMGRYREAKAESTLFSDILKYNPTSQQWTRIEPRLSSGEKVTLSAGTGLAVGANHVFLFGGAKGNMLNQFERLEIEIASANSFQTDSLIDLRDSLQQFHEGFCDSIYAFHTITETLTKIGNLPLTSQVTTTALSWEDTWIIPSGEIRPCIRTPTILIGQARQQVSFGLVNYIVLGLYLLVLIVMGIILSRNQETTEDFFKGGNRIPWWAAGISIFGTQLSAITFMAVPAKTFATDWLYFVLMITIILAAPIIVRYFLPFFRRHNLTTAYEYLELRFNYATRLIGSAMYILLQFGRLAIVLLLPSLALSVVTGIDVSVCIISMGILSILYTVLGGIEAVIWTDVLQVIVLLGGALLSLILLLMNLDGSDIATISHNYQKTRVFDFTFDFTDATFWVVLIGGLASNIVQYGSDQTVVQRYLTTKDEHGARQGIWTGAWMTLPATLIFFSLGTLLFIHYLLNSHDLNPTLQKTDAIFPWFIVTSLPQGISGLLIAAIFAASMSSLDSSMNSVSTVVTTDFYRRLNQARSESHYLRFARTITLIVGILGTGIALFLAKQGIPSLWDQFNLIIGLFAGGLGGVFVLGIFFPKANGQGAIVGLLASALVQYLVKEYTHTHFLLYAFTGLASCVVIGLLYSILRPDNRQNKNEFTLRGLTQQ